MKNECLVEYTFDRKIDESESSREKKIEMEVIIIPGTIEY